MHETMHFMFLYHYKKYCEDRDWDQFHNPKELAIGLITEASEVLEHFRFKSEKEMEAFFKDSKKREDIECGIAGSSSNGLGSEGRMIRGEM